MTLNGAQAVVRTLGDAGITTCFTNPGTTEIHFVAALDSTPRIRPILTLFEGVATGAADGYARMADAPAATLLHLGPGFGNGLANLHNARRAGVPVLNIVGDHATSHVKYDVPLQSDIETIARNVSGWLRTARTPDTLAGDAADAVAAAIGPPGEVATLIVPADLAWQEGVLAALPLPPAAEFPAASEELVERTARAMRSSRRTAILLGGRALRERGLVAAARIAAATGARVLGEMLPARVERGAGRPTVERLAYWPDLASAQLEDLDHLILADAKSPASFFAYPGQSGSLLPPGCEVHELSPFGCDVLRSLEGLVQALDACDARLSLQTRMIPPQPHGPLSAAKACAVIGATLPEGAIISDESITSGMLLPPNTAGAPAHDWLALTGGAIGQGLPVAVGAAVACPDRPVIALQADGSAMYTIQSLWTMAREQLNVTVIIFNNRAYDILNVEFFRAGGEAPGPNARAQLELRRPDIDFVALATGLGIGAQRVGTAEELSAAMNQAIADPGPHLIEAIIPPVDLRRIAV
ncbi:MAG: acetolactate synthase large subunit [Solirubrobacteraceae bacterium]